MTPSSTGSKNGLVIWSVFATVIGLGSLIWGFISFAQANKAQDDLEAAQRSYNEIIDRAGLSGANVAALKEVAGDSARGYSGMKYLDIAVQQKNDLAMLVGGSNDDQKARSDAEKAVAEAQKVAGPGATIPTTLNGALKGMTEVVNARIAENAALAEQLEEANKARDAALAEKATIMQIADEKVAAATTEAAESQKTADEYAKAQDSQLADQTEQRVAKERELLDTSTQSNERIVELQQQLASVQAQLDQRNADMAKYRVPTNQILTAADGVITRTPGTDRVFINLGRGDQIAPGMTFEVYDKLGAPNVAADNPDDDRLLKGKASIEVIAPQQGISECRVVRVSPGATITEGDPILNVVYDKNVKFNYYVFGKFNLDYAGEANDRDTEIVKRLISGWGANVTDEINSKTDFVVLGQEPEVPAYSQEELATQPELAYQKEQAEQALDVYTEVKARANALNIPILNQTRFLYLIGYYDEAAR